MGFSAKKFPPGKCPSRREKWPRKNLRSCVLRVEDLRCDTDQDHHKDRGQNGFGQHVGGVVHGTVQPAQTVHAHVGDAGKADLGHPAESVVVVLPDDVTGQKAAQKAQQAHHKGADTDTHGAAAERLCDQAGKAQHREGQKVVQQHAAHLCREGLAVCQIAKALHKLDQAVDESGHDAPLCAVAVAHYQNGHHAEQGDGTAVGHERDLDHAQNGGQGDHQRTLHQNAGFGIGFGHRDSSSQNDSTQKQNAPAFQQAHGVCERTDSSANSHAGIVRSGKRVLRKTRISAFRHPCFYVHAKV